jgi:hypothetical protein
VAVADPALTTVAVGGATLTWRLTPWDQRALGVPTAEITSLGGEPADVPALLARFDAVCAEHAIGMAITRIPAEARAEKLHLQEAGWRYVETSHPLHLEPIPADFAALGAVGRRRVPVELATLADQPELAALAAAAFDHSRFHEDPRVHVARARARHGGWIADGFARGDECLVHRDRAGAIAALMTYRRRGDAVQLFLGGPRPGAELIAPMFWVAVLDALRERGARRVDTRVSAANLGAMRLHLALGFVTVGCDLGFARLFPAGAAVASPPDPGRLP